jgi:hypothetical protein
MSVRDIIQAAAGGAVQEPDPFFNQTVLLLHGDGTNGGQNNTFIDSSSNNFTVTRNGNTTQGSFSPYGNLWSNYFDGNGDFLTAPSSAAFNLGGGNFTVEGWFYWTGLQSAPHFFQFGSSSVNRWTALVFSGNFYLFNQTDSLINTGVAGIKNSWFHLAVTKNSTTTRLFLNGTQIYSSTTFAYPTGNLIAAIGYQNFGTDSNDYLQGFCSNFRVVKGTAVYTSAFTPPTAPLTAITNTELLTCQSNRFVDNSSNNFAITRNGNVTVTNFTPFQPTAAYNPAVNGGSGYFDGTGDYLTIADNSAFDLPGDFTLETFVYPLALAANNTLCNITLGDEGSGLNGFGVFVQSSSMGFYSNDTNIISVSNLVKIAEWAHIAVSRSGSSLKFYLNGVERGSATNSTSFTGVAGNGVIIGGSYYNGSTEARANGFYSNVRLVKGTALYTTNFTPPTAPLTAVTNTELLCNFVNAAIFDNTQKNNLETVGNAQIDTAVKKYGTGSIEFDGTGDWLLLPRTPVLSFGTSNFTIEGWAYVTSINSTFRCIFSIGAPVQIYAKSGTIEVYLNDSDDTASYIVDDMLGPASSVSVDTWFHFAVVRNGTVFTAYVNGVGGTPVSGVSAPVFYSATAPAVGVYGTTSSLPFTGYIDDFRITNGVARYTANFTPPAQAFPNL